MRAAAVWLRSRLGRRGTDLAVFGVLELVYGWGIVSNPRYGVVRGVGVLNTWAPMTVWGAVWMLCGAAALVLAAHPAHLPSDSWGYCALLLPTGLWAGANLTAQALGQFNQAYTSATTWGLLFLHLWLCNRRPEVAVAPLVIPAGGARGGS